MKNKLFTLLYVSIGLSLVSTFSHAQNMTDYLFEDFNYLRAAWRPNGWTGSFSVIDDGGIDNSKRFATNLIFLDWEKSMETNPIMMGSNPVLKFYYRALDWDTYPENTIAGNGLKLEVFVSNDFGTTWNSVHLMNYGKHIPSFDYQLIDIDVSDYANETCIVKLNIVRDTNSGEAFWFDIDNVTIGTQPDSDLALIPDLEGAHLIERGKECRYTVTIKNLGISSLNSYTIGLMNANGSQIASIDGRVIASNETQQYELAWTPNETGEVYIYAKVESTGDENPLNDKTHLFKAVVQPDGTEAITIVEGEGNDLIYTPYDFYSKNSLSQTLYLSEEINTSEGNLAGIVYKTKFDIPVENVPITIWVGETDMENLFEAWVAPSTLEKVFEGTVSFSDIDGDYVIINFDTPYKYKGGNLVIHTLKEHNVIYDYYETVVQFYGLYKLSFVRIRTFSSDERIDALTPPEQLNSIFTTPFTALLFNNNTGNYMETINNSTTTLSVYPNPTSGRFRIEETSGIKEVQIYDISGRTVYKANNVNRNEMEVDISDLSNGIYLLKVNNETMKIMKQ